ncbi:hypothetical protein WH96_07850 [Kiloniella spongiae]|uniref:DUF4197 domain-containing protein n=1 Tax=Kiloniella spongiae TaxID=1489064 RepID=A0A0H2MFD5_9PROT|nr:DUF4197 domain-containing protein [Kiloniella spongiae]KLN61083.1 hypothetical protein WH96_07850 [Kiloniella spongiae]
MFKKSITVSAALSFTLFTLPVEADLFSDGLKILQGGDAKQGEQSQGNLSVGEISAGLKEALRVGSSRVVDQVSLQDGFNADSNIHIPLPDNLKKVQGALRTVGLSSMADDLELKLNRGAEKASVETRELFLDTISKMTLEDARRIYDGRNDEATRYFREKMSPELTAKFKPIIDRTLSEVGAVNSYEEMISSYKTIPFVPDVKSDLTDYTVSKALEGLFYYLAKEEEQIRQNPVARTTEILKNVFGS